MLRIRDHLFVCVGILSLQSIGQIDRAVAPIEILLVEHPDALEMGLQGVDKDGRQDRDAVFLAFAVADSDADCSNPTTIGEINVLNP